VSDAEENYWLNEECARAFWDQQEAAPYQQLLRHTTEWLEPQAGQRWLDLGCGGGRLTAELWRLSGGRLAEIAAMDCNPANAEALERVRARLSPPPTPGQVRFVTGNFSAGLPQFSDATFDGVVCGLALSYAEHKDAATGRYTDLAYDKLLAEVRRVLRPGGRFVFSVNVPQPRFWRVFWKSLRRARRVAHPVRALLNGLRMQWYGHWLGREAARGRFHFFPIQEITARLEKAGFTDYKYRLSYAEQAFLIQTGKEPAVAQAA
jgi:ubiquinone/menaquinone biosynthesis C-methylase UbiE